MKKYRPKGRAWQNEDRETLEENSVTKEDKLASGSIAKIPKANVALEIGYRTRLGSMYVSTVEQLIESRVGHRLKGSVQLIFTSPPFPLNRKKRYGNRTGDAYLKWLSDLAPYLVDLLTPDGSIVMELGNAWEPGKPVMSTLALRAMLEFLETANLNLCQQFICHNPARLPSPAQWVNVERIRVKDSFTHVWWMAPSERPKADNRKVLTPYKKDMQALLETGSYNGGLRPSGHRIGETSFLKDNGGAIPPSVLEIANTSSGNDYRRYCREHSISAHPAPMQPALAEFFVNFLTNKGDLVFDPFGGSNTTGAVAEQLARKWVTTEPSAEYVEGSKGRFPQFLDDKS